VSVLNCVLSVLLLVTWHGCFSSLGLYESRRFLGLLREAVDVMLAATMSALLLAAWGIVFRVEIVSASMLLLFWAGSVTMLMACRLATQAVLRRLRRKGRNLRLALIVGTNT